MSATSIAFLSEYDPAWPSRFEELSRRVREAVGDAVVAVEHVGSTAVPEQVARPIVDIDVAVADYSRAYELRGALEAAGFERLLDGDFADRQFYILREGGRPVCHLSLTYLGSPTWRNHHALRNRLRSDPNARRRYGDLKRKLAGRGREKEASLAAITELIRDLGGIVPLHSPPEPFLTRRRAVVGGLIMALLLGSLGLYGAFGYLAEYSRGPDGLPDHRPVRASDLWPRLPAKLYYPGSAVISTRGHDGSTDVGAAPAQVETTLRADAAPSALADWYSRELSRQGWLPVPVDGPPAGGETDLNWRKGAREYFELRLLAPPIGTALAYAVRYEIGTGR